MPANIRNLVAGKKSDPLTLRDGMNNIAKTKHFFLEGIPIGFDKGTGGRRYYDLKNEDKDITWMFEALKTKMGCVGIHPHCVLCNRVLLPLASKSVVWCTSMRIV